MYKIIVKQNVGKYNIGGLAINHQICQSFLPPMFCDIWYVVAKLAPYMIQD